jgi:flavin-dependent dehydrogenase
VIGIALEEGPDIMEKFVRFRKKLTEVGFKLGTPLRREGTRINRPTGPGQIVTGNDKIALVGEAAGFISPSSAEGISYAVKSAMILAEALDEGVFGLGQRYARMTRPIKRNIVGKNIKVPFLYQPFLRNLAMRSGLFSSHLEW